MRTREEEGPMPAFEANETAAPPAPGLFTPGFTLYVALALDEADHQKEGSAIGHAARVTLAGFHRYLETVLPEDNARTRLLSQNAQQSTPEESLVTLRHGLTAANEVLDGMLRAPRLPFRPGLPSLPSGTLRYRQADRGSAHGATLRLCDTAASSVPKA